MSFISNKPKPNYQISGNHNESLSYIQNKNNNQNNFQIGHPSGQSFISTGPHYNNNKLIQCSSQNIMYGHDNASGAPIFQQKNQNQ